MMVVFFQRFLDRNGNYEKRRTLDISQQTKTKIFEKKNQIKKSNQKNPFSELPGPIPMIFGPKKSAFALVFDFSFLGSNADVDISQKTRHSHSRSKITNSRILVSRRVDGLGKCFHRQNN